MSGSAYKLTILLKAQEQLAPDAFADEWLRLEHQQPLDRPGLVRHVFDRPLALPPLTPKGAAAPYDAAVETWWRRKNDAADWVTSRQFEDAWLPPRLELLQERPAAVGGAPQLIWEREPATGAQPARFLSLPVAQRRLTIEEFIDHWTGVHAQLALDGPGTRARLVSVEATPGRTAPPAKFARTRYDGVGASTFESAQALAAELASEHYAECVLPDQPRFCDPASSAAMLTTPITLR